MTTMATFSLRSANYRIEFTKMTLTMTADFALKAYDPSTEEYEILTRLKKDFPDLKIERKTHRTPSKYKTKSGEEYNHNQFKDLSYNRMEKFLSRIPNGATYQKEYECVKDFATDLNGNGYPLVRKWFVEQFPNFRKNPMFYLNNSPELISGIAFLNKETSAPEADEVEAPDVEETAVPELKRA